ncbi:MAG: hypothetical protein K9K67_05070 [Bacteriovoracaceae bacterium]|nr:hypothetical protein [Bacteriovoracaceae bacterium]
MKISNQKISFALMTLILSLQWGQVNAKDSIEGQITLVENCSQKKEAGVFTSDKDRDLKCQRIQKPINRNCLLSIDNLDKPKKITANLAGANLKTFKGGLFLYERLRQVGIYRRKAGIFSKKVDADHQIEILLERSNTSQDHELTEAIVYLNHTKKGERIYWTQYSCEF